HDALPISSATDSTWGRPTSMASTVENGGGEANGISSVIYDQIISNTDGTQVWKLNLSDGGANANDDDDLPTILTYLRLRRGAYNNVSNWSTAIESIGLFDDSTGALLATGSVSTSQITFSGFTATAADDNYRPRSIRLSLEERAHTDNSIFHFIVTDADIQPEGLLTSSQKTSFSIDSDSSQNFIEVLASKLQFLTQPPSSIE